MGSLGFLDQKYFLCLFAYWCVLWFSRECFWVRKAHLALSYSLIKEHELMLCRSWPPRLYTSGPNLGSTPLRFWVSLKYLQRYSSHHISASSWQPAWVISTGNGEVGWVPGCSCSPWLGRHQPLAAGRQEEHANNWPCLLSPTWLVLRPGCQTLAGCLLLLSPAICTLWQGCLGISNFYRLAAAAIQLVGTVCCLYVRCQLCSLRYLGWYKNLKQCAFHTKSSEDSFGLLYSGHNCSVKS